MAFSRCHPPLWDKPKVDPVLSPRRDPGALGLGCAPPCHELGGGSGSVACDADQGPAPLPPPPTNPPPPPARAEHPPPPDPPPPPARRGRRPPPPPPTPVVGGGGGGGVVL